MARVAAHRLHLALVAVEGLGVEAALRHPEHGVELGLERVGLPLQLGGDLLPAQGAEVAGQPRLGVVDVALDLDQGRGQRRLLAVGADQGVVGVLPALVAHPQGGVLRVLDQAVLVEIAVAVDPLQGREHVGQQLAEEIDVTRPVQQLHQ